MVQVFRSKKNYFTIADFYQIAMTKLFFMTFFIAVIWFSLFFSVIHPSFKHKYFKISHWSQDWIKVAINLTQVMCLTNYKPQFKKTSSKNVVAKPKVSNYCFWIHFLFIVIVTLLDVFPESNQFNHSTWCCFSSTLRHFINKPSWHLSLWRPHLRHIQEIKCPQMVAETKLRRKNLRWSFKNGSWCPEFPIFILILWFSSENFILDCF